MDTKIWEILRVVDEIERHSRPIIEHCYREFLLHNYDCDEREYPDAADQIREVLVHANYLSQKDIEIFPGFDLDVFVARTGHEGMRELHEALLTEHGSNDSKGAA